MLECTSRVCVVGKPNASMYIRIRMALWTLLALRGNLWALLNRDAGAEAGAEARAKAGRYCAAVCD